MWSLLQSIYMWFSLAFIGWMFVRWSKEGVVNTFVKTALFGLCILNIVLAYINYA